MRLATSSPTPLFLLLNTSAFRRLTFLDRRSLLPFPPHPRFFSTPTAMEHCRHEEAPSSTPLLLQQQQTSLETFWQHEGPTIGTHDGRFHLDEILACAMLLSLPEFSNAKILRTRDPALHEKCEILVDVGGVHDAETKRFDHHQRGFTTTFDFAKYEAAPPESLLEPCQLENPPRLREAVTKLSSAGLVYVHFGIRLLRERFGIEDEGSLRAMMLEVYTQFVEAVDAHDNGVGISRGGPPMYVDKTSLPHRIAALFPFGGEDAAKQRQQQTVAAWEMQQALAAEACAETHAPQYAAAKEALGRGCVSPFNWLHVPIYGGEPLDVWAFRKGLKLADEAFAAAVSFLRDSWLPGRPVLKQALTEGAAGILKTHVVELPKWSPTEVCKSNCATEPV
ncbi:melanocyte proliferating gene protein [Cyclospora cayetanensis]|uniref:Melanocyte proliferating gene protein n=1 Tax=Cyclospora cayetanensis TaxID=88456 RepID=A0A1D3D0K2_9EIME|nr:melanocyte proliferating gene protein [Cyclospora cayetanensis]